MDGEVKENMTKLTDLVKNTYKAIDSWLEKRKLLDLP